MASEAMASAPVSAFKRSEKRWKRASTREVYRDASLVDARALVASLPAERAQHVRRAGTWPGGQPILAFDGEDAARHGGFFVIPGALDAAQQLRLARACLAEYAEQPHVTNMHLQNAQVAGIWRKARAFSADQPDRCPTLAKLRWAAAGYHYEWTERKYFERDFSPVPPLLEELAARCAEACGMTLKAEAVIVNFYRPGSTMGGHQDDVEVTMDHPVVSVSLGSDCVFLKGGLSKDDPPLELLLRSGDIAVFGGNSRLSFHGVARVLPTPFAITDREWQELVGEERESENGPSRAASGGGDDVEAELAAVRSYLSTRRININIRQVFPATGTMKNALSNEPHIM